jgi:hypothetical protein
MLPFSFHISRFSRRSEGQYGNQIFVKVNNFVGGDRDNGDNDEGDEGDDKGIFHQALSLLMLVHNASDRERVDTGQTPPPYKIINKQCNRFLGVRIE